MTKNGLIAFVSVTVCLTPAILLAEDGPTSLVFQGKLGFWVPSTLFLEMEQRYEAAPGLELELGAKKEEASHLRVSLHKMSETASSAMERRGFFKDAYDAERAAREEAEQRGLLEEPVLWFAVGALAAGLVFYLTRDDSPDVVVAGSP